MQDVQDWRRYAVIFPFMDAQRPPWNQHIKTEATSLLPSLLLTIKISQLLGGGLPSLSLARWRPYPNHKCSILSLIQVTVITGLGLPWNLAAWPKTPTQRFVLFPVHHFMFTHYNCHSISNTARFLLAFLCRRPSVPWHCWFGDRMEDVIQQ